MPKAWNLIKLVAKLIKADGNASLRDKEVCATWSKIKISKEHFDSVAEGDNGPFTLGLSISGTSWLSPLKAIRV